MSSIWERAKDSARQRITDSQAAEQHDPDAALFEGIDLDTPARIAAERLMAAQPKTLTAARDAAWQRLESGDEL